MWSEKKRHLFLLSLILLVTSMFGTGAAIALLYNQAVEERRSDLQVTAQSQARLIETVAQHELLAAPFFLDELPDYDPLEATLKQVVTAHQKFAGFGKTGEFTLAQHVGDQIIFRFRHQANDVSQPEPVPFDSNLAEPMRRALSGQSGSMIGLDYHGATVLAAYEPVSGLNLGIVVKADLAEVRQPFIIAGLISILLSTLLVTIGIIFLRRTINPLFFSLHSTTDELASEMQQHKQALEALRESDERFRQIADAAEDVLWLIDCVDPEAPQFLYVSKAYEVLVNHPRPEILEKFESWLLAIHPEDLNRITVAFQRFLQGETPLDEEFRISLQNNAIRYVSIKGGLIRNNLGQIIRAAGLIHDISTIKTAELMVQQANMELELKVAERTAELRRTIKLMTGRELRMVELKQEISRLQAQLTKGQA